MPLQHLNDSPFDWPELQPVRVYEMFDAVLPEPHDDVM